MVSKAIERAQTTVEQKNGEIRKNVLKYDEVMNAQRKVIYALRDQILDKADLREKILTEHLPEAVEALVATYCVADIPEEWDLDGLHTRSEEHTSELQSLMRISYAVFCLKKKKHKNNKK